MLDKYLLQALKERKRFNTLRHAVPTDVFSQDTVSMIKWFDRYFKQYVEHDEIDVDTLETFIKLEGKLKDDQFVIIKRMLQGLREEVPQDVLRQTVHSLNDLRTHAELAMLLKRYDEGVEIDLINEVLTVTQIAKQRSDTQDKAMWCDEDIWELIQADSDDSGYKFTCLPAEIHDNLKGANTGDNILVAMPTDKGKTSLLCRIAVCLAQQHKEFLVDGTEPEFRPILYLVNEGQSKRITPRMYQTVLEYTRNELFDLGNTKGSDGIIKAYNKIVGRKDAIRLVDIHGFSVGQVARIIEAHNPFCVITDMTGRIKAPSAQGANDVAQLEQVWDAMRQLAAIHDFIHIGTAQVSVEGMDMMYPPLTALQNSKTGIQTTIDLAIYGGAWLSPQSDDDANTRGLSTPKNKLVKSGAKGYNKVETIVNFERNIWS